jgi:rhodanese-related sulfurtransferase
MKFLIIFSAILLVVQSQRIATYEDIRKLPNHPKILLIDVREFHEIEQTGLIPTSIVIPGELIAEIVQLALI